MSSAVLVFGAIAAAAAGACRSAERTPPADKVEGARAASPGGDEEGRATPPRAIAAAVPDPGAVPALPSALKAQELGPAPTSSSNPSASGEAARALTQTSPPSLPEGCRGFTGKVAFAAAEGSKCDAARCASLGGQCGTAGLGCSDACIYKATDAGKSCIDQSECQGDCLLDKAAQRGQAAKGQCSSLKAAPGCLNRARKGVSAGVLCVD